MPARKSQRTVLPKPAVVAKPRSQDGGKAGKQGSRRASKTEVELLMECVDDDLSPAQLKAIELAQQEHEKANNLIKAARAGNTLVPSSQPNTFTIVPPTPKQVPPPQPPPRTKTPPTMKSLITPPQVTQERGLPPPRPDQFMKKHQATANTSPDVIVIGETPARSVSRSLPQQPGISLMQNANVTPKQVYKFVSLPGNLPGNQQPQMASSQWVIRPIMTVPPQQQGLMTSSTQSGMPVLMQFTSMAQQVTPTPTNMISYNQNPLQTGDDGRGSEGSRRSYDESGRSLYEQMIINIKGGQSEQRASTSSALRNHSKGHVYCPIISKKRYYHSAVLGRLYGKKKASQAYRVSPSFIDNLTNNYKCLLKHVKRKVKQHKKLKKVAWGKRNVPDRLKLMRVKRQSSSNEIRKTCHEVCNNDRDSLQNLSACRNSNTDLEVGRKLEETNERCEEYANESCSCRGAHVFPKSYCDTNMGHLPQSQILAYDTAEDLVQFPAYLDEKTGQLNKFDLDEKTGLLNKFGLNEEEERLLEMTKLADSPLDGLSSTFIMTENRGISDFGVLDMDQSSREYVSDIDDSSLSDNCWSDREHSPMSCSYESCFLSFTKQRDIIRSRLFEKEDEKVHLDDSETLQQVTGLDNAHATEENCSDDSLRKKEILLNGDTGKKNEKENENMNTNCRQVTAGEDNVLKINKENVFDMNGNRKLENCIEDEIYRKGEDHGLENSKKKLDLTDESSQDSPSDTFNDVRKVMEELDFLNNGGSVMAKCSRETVRESLAEDLAALKHSFQESKWNCPIISRENGKDKISVVDVFDYDTGSMPSGGVITNRVVLNDRSECGGQKDQSFKVFNSRIAEHNNMHCLAAKPSKLPNEQENKQSVNQITNRAIIQVPMAPLGEFPKFYFRPDSLISLPKLEKLVRSCYEDGDSEESIINRNAEKCKSEHLDKKTDSFENRNDNILKTSSLDKKTVYECDKGGSCCVQEVCLGKNGTGVEELTTETNIEVDDSCSQWSDCSSECGRLDEEDSAKTGRKFTSNNEINDISKDRLTFTGKKSLKTAMTSNEMTSFISKKMENKSGKTANKCSWYKSMSWGDICYVVVLCGHYGLSKMSKVLRIPKTQLLTWRRALRKARLDVGINGIPKKLGQAKFRSVNSGNDIENPKQLLRYHPDLYNKAQLLISSLKVENSDNDETDSSLVDENNGVNSEKDDAAHFDDSQELEENISSQSLQPCQLQALQDSQYQLQAVNGALHDSGQFENTAVDIVCNMEIAESENGLGGIPVCCDNAEDILPKYFPAMGTVTCTEDINNEKVDDFENLLNDTLIFCEHSENAKGDFLSKKEMASNPSDKKDQVICRSDDVIPVEGSLMKSAGNKSCDTSEPSLVKESYVEIIVQGKCDIDKSEDDNILDAESFVIVENTEFQSATENTNEEVGQKKMVATHCDKVETDFADEKDKLCSADSREVTVLTDKENTKSSSRGFENNASIIKSNNSEPIKCENKLCEAKSSSQLNMLSSTIERLKNNLQKFETDVDKEQDKQSSDDSDSDTESDCHNLVIDYDSAGDDNDDDDDDNETERSESRQSHSSIESQETIDDEEGEADEEDNEAVFKNLESCNKLQLSDESKTKYKTDKTKDQRSEKECIDNKDHKATNVFSSDHSYFKTSECGGINPASTISNSRLESYNENDQTNSLVDWKPLADKNILTYPQEEFEEITGRKVRVFKTLSAEQKKNIIKAYYKHGLDHISKEMRIPKDYMMEILSEIIVKNPELYYGEGKVETTPSDVKTLHSQPASHATKQKKYLEIQDPHHGTFISLSDITEKLQGKPPGKEYLILGKSRNSTGTSPVKIQSESLQHNTGKIILVERVEPSPQNVSSANGSSTAPIIKIVSSVQTADNLEKSDVIPRTNRSKLSTNPTSVETTASERHILHPPKLSLCSASGTLVKTLEAEMLNQPSPVLTICNASTVSQIKPQNQVHETIDPIPNSLFETPQRLTNPDAIMEEVNKVGDIQPTDFKLIKDNSGRRIFTKEFKEKIVLLSMKIGTPEVTKYYNIPSKTVYIWRKKYRSEKKNLNESCNPGLANRENEKKRKRTNIVFCNNLKIKLAHLARRFGLASVSKQYNINISTLGKWARQYKDEKLSSYEFSAEDLLQLVEYVEQKLENKRFNEIEKEKKDEENIEISKSFTRHITSASSHAVSQEHIDTEQDILGGCGEQSLIEKMLTEGDAGTDANLTVDSVAGLQSGDINQDDMREKSAEPYNIAESKSAAPSTTEHNSGEMVLKHIPGKVSIKQTTFPNRMEVILGDGMNSEESVDSQTDESEVTAQCSESSEKSEEVSLLKLQLTSTVSVSTAEDTLIEKCCVNETPNKYFNEVVTPKIPDMETTDIGKDKPSVANCNTNKSREVNAITSDSNNTNPTTDEESSEHEVNPSSVASDIPCQLLSPSEIKEEPFDEEFDLMDKPPSLRKIRNGKDERDSTKDMSVERNSASELGNFDTGQGLERSRHTKTEGVRGERPIVYINELGLGNDQGITQPQGQFGTSGSGNSSSTGNYNSTAVFQASGSNTAGYSSTGATSPGSSIQPASYASQVFIVGQGIMGNLGPTYPTLSQALFNSQLRQQEQHRSSIARTIERDTNVVRSHLATVFQLGTSSDSSDGAGSHLQQDSYQHQTSYHHSLPSPSCSTSTSPSNSLPMNIMLPSRNQPLNLAPTSVGYQQSDPNNHVSSIPPPPKLKKYSMYVSDGDVERAKAIRDAMLAKKVVPQGSNTHTYATSKKDSHSATPVEEEVLHNTKSPTVKPVGNSVADNHVSSTAATSFKKTPGCGRIESLIQSVSNRLQPSPQREQLLPHTFKPHGEKMKSLLCSDTLEKFRGQLTSPGIQVKRPSILDNTDLHDNQVIKSNAMDVVKKSQTGKVKSEKASKVGVSKQFTAVTEHQDRSASSESSLGDTEFTASGTENSEENVEDVNIDLTEKLKSLLNADIFNVSEDEEEAGHSDDDDDDDGDGEDLIDILASSGKKKKKSEKGYSLNETRNKTQFEKGKEHKSASSDEHNNGKNIQRRFNYSNGLKMKLGKLAEKYSNSQIAMRYQVSCKSLNRWKLQFKDVECKNLEFTKAELGELRQLKQYKEDCRMSGSQYHIYIDNPEPSILDSNDDDFESDNQTTSPKKHSVDELKQVSSDADSNLPSLDSGLKNNVSRKDAGEKGKADGEGNFKQLYRLSSGKSDVKQSPPKATESLQGKTAAKLGFPSTSVNSTISGSYKTSSVGRTAHSSENSDYTASSIEQMKSGDVPLYLSVPETVPDTVKERLRQKVKSERSEQSSVFMGSPECISKTVGVFSPSSSLKGSSKDTIKVDSAESTKEENTASSTRIVSPNESSKSKDIGAFVAYIEKEDNTSRPILSLSDDKVNQDSAGKAITSNVTCSSTSSVEEETQSSTIVKTESKKTVYLCPIEGIFKYRDSRSASSDGLKSLESIASKPLSRSISQDGSKQSASNATPTTGTLEANVNIEKPVEMVFSDHSYISPEKQNCPLSGMHSIKTNSESVNKSETTWELNKDGSTTVSKTLLTDNGNYSFAFKAKVVEEAKKSGFENTAKWFNIQMTDIMKWHDAFFTEQPDKRYVQVVVLYARKHGIEATTKVFPASKAKITEWLSLYQELKDGIDNETELEAAKTEKTGLSFETIKGKHGFIVKPKFAEMNSANVQVSTQRTRMGPNVIKYATHTNPTASSYSAAASSFQQDVQGDLGAMPRIVKQNTSTSDGLVIESTWKQIQSIVNPKTAERKFSLEFKNRIIKECEERGQKNIAKEHKIPYNEISRWRLESKKLSAAKKPETSAADAAPATVTAPATVAAAMRKTVEPQKVDSAVAKQQVVTPEKASTSRPKSETESLKITIKLSKKPEVISKPSESGINIRTKLSSNKPDPVKKPEVRNTQELSRVPNIVKKTEAINKPERRRGEDVSGRGEVLSKQEITESVDIMEPSTCVDEDSNMRMQVINYCFEHGVLKTQKQFSVTRQSVIDLMKEYDELNKFAVDAYNRDHGFRTKLVSREKTSVEVTNTGGPIMVNNLQDYIVTPEYKQTVVEYARQHGITAATRKYKRKTSTVKNWMAHHEKTERNNKRMEESLTAQKDVNEKDAGTNISSSEKVLKSPRRLSVQSETSSVKSPSSQKHKTPPPSPIWEQDFVIKPSTGRSPLKLTLSPRGKSPVINIVTSEDEETNDIETEDEDVDVNTDFEEVASWDLGAEEARKREATNKVEVIDIPSDNETPEAKIDTLKIMPCPTKTVKISLAKSGNDPVSAAPERMDNNNKRKQMEIEVVNKTIQKSETEKAHEDIFISPIDVPNIMDMDMFDSVSSTDSVNKGIHVNSAKTSITPDIQTNNMSEDVEMGNKSQEQADNLVELEKTNEKLTNVEISSDVGIKITESSPNKKTEIVIVDDDTENDKEESMKEVPKTKDNPSSVENTVDDETIETHDEQKEEEEEEEIETIPYEKTVMFKLLTDEVDNFFSDVSAGLFGKDKSHGIDSDGVKEQKQKPTGVKKQRRYADFEIMENIEETCLFTPSRLQRIVLDKELENTVDVVDEGKHEEKNVQNTNEKDVLAERNSGKSNLEEAVDSKEQSTISKKQNDETENKTDENLDKNIESQRKSERSIFDFMFSSEDSEKKKGNDSLSTNSEIEVKTPTSEPAKPNMGPSFGLFGNLIKSFKIPPSPSVNNVTESKGNVEQVVEHKAEEPASDVDMKEKNTDDNKDDAKVKDRSERNVFDFMSPEPIVAAVLMESPGKGKPAEPFSSPVKTATNSQVETPATSVKKPMFKFPKFTLPVNFGNIAKLGMAKLKQDEKLKVDKPSDTNTLVSVASSNEKQTSFQAEEIKDKPRQDNSKADAQTKVVSKVTAEAEGSAKTESSHIGVVMETFEELRKRLAKERAANKIEKENSAVESNNTQCKTDNSKISGSIKATGIVDYEMYKEFTPQKIVLILDISKKHGIEFASTSFGLPVSVIVNWIIEKDRKHRKSASSVCLEDKLLAVRDLQQLGEEALEDLAIKYSVEITVLINWKVEVSWLLKQKGVEEVLGKWQKIQSVSDLFLDDIGKNNQKESKKSKELVKVDDVSSSDTLTVSESISADLAIITNSTVVSVSDSSIADNTAVSGSSPATKAVASSISSNVERTTCSELTSGTSNAASCASNASNTGVYMSNEASATRSEAAGHESISNTKPETSKSACIKMDLVAAENLDSHRANVQSAENLDSRPTIVQSAETTENTCEVDTKHLETANNTNLKLDTEPTNLTSIKSDTEPTNDTSLLKDDPVTIESQFDDSVDGSPVADSQAKEAEPVQEYPNKNVQIPDVLSFTKHLNPRDYNLEQKAMIVVLLDKYGIKDVHQKLGINKGTLWTWKNQNKFVKNFILEQTGGVKRKKKETEKDKSGMKKATKLPEKVSPKMTRSEAAMSRFQPVDRKSIKSDSHSKQSKPVTSLSKQSSAQSVDGKNKDTSLSENQEHGEQHKGYRQISPTKLPEILRDARKIPTKDFTLEQRVAIVRLVELYGVRTIHKQFRIPSGSIWNWQHNKHVTDILKQDRDAGKDGKDSYESPMLKVKRNLKLDEIESEDSQPLTIDSILDKVLVSIETTNHLGFKLEQKAEVVCLINHFGLDYVCEKIPQVPRGTLWNWCRNKNIVTIVERKSLLLKKGKEDRSGSHNVASNRENKVVAETSTGDYEIDKAGMTQRWLNAIQNSDGSLKRKHSSEIAESKSKIWKGSQSFDEAKKKAAGEMDGGNSDFEETGAEWDDELAASSGIKSNVGHGIHGDRRNCSSPSTVSSAISEHSNDFEEILTEDEVQTPSIHSRKSETSVQYSSSSKTSKNTRRSGKEQQVYQSIVKSIKVLPGAAGTIVTDSDEHEETVFEVVKFEADEDDRMMVCYRTLDTSGVPVQSAVKLKSVETSSGGVKRPASEIEPTLTGSGGVKRSAPGTEVGSGKKKTPPAKEKGLGAIDSSGNWVPLDEYYYGTTEGDTNYTEEKEEFRFKCWYCSKMLYNNVRAMQHIQGHIDSSKQQNIDLSDLTQCKHCYKQFDTPFEMQTHVEKVHLSNKVLMCRICEKDMASPRDLTQHMRQNHKACEMPYVCQLCNFRSSMYSDVVDHFKKKHDSSNSLLCLYCLRTFDVKFVSQGWGQTQTYYGHLLKHQSKSSAKKCGVCRLTFFNATDVKIHRKNHHVSNLKGIYGTPGGGKYSAQDPVMIKVPESGPMPQKKGSSTSLKSLNAPSVSKIQDYGDVRLPGEANTSFCFECKMTMSSTDHYKKYINCSMCRFATSCSVAYANHMMGFHSGQMSSLNLNIPWERPMAVAMYCSCGFATKYGNKIADHLVSCLKGTCFYKKPDQVTAGAPSVTAGKKEDGSLLGVLGLVQKKTIATRSKKTDGIRTSPIQAEPSTSAGTGVKKKTGPKPGPKSKRGRGRTISPAPVKTLVDVKQEQSEKTEAKIEAKDEKVVVEIPKENTKSKEKTEAKTVAKDEKDVELPKENTESKEKTEAKTVATDEKGVVEKPERRAESKIKGIKKKEEDSSKTADEQMETEVSEKIGKKDGSAEKKSEEEEIVSDVSLNVEKCGAKKMDQSEDRIDKSEPMAATDTIPESKEIFKTDKLDENISKSDPSGDRKIETDSIEAGSLENIEKDTNNVEDDAAVQTQTEEADGLNKKEESETAKESEPMEAEDAVEKVDGEENKDTDKMETDVAGVDEDNDAEMKDETVGDLEDKDEDDTKMDEDLEGTETLPTETETTSEPSQDESEGTGTIGDEVLDSKDEEQDKGDNHETDEGDNHETDKGDTHETDKGDNHETNKGDTHETDKGDNHETDKGDNHETDEKKDSDLETEIVDKEEDKSDATKHDDGKTTENEDLPEVVEEEKEENKQETEMEEEKEKQETSSESKEQTSSRGDHRDRHDTDRSHGDSHSRSHRQDYDRNRHDNRSHDERHRHDDNRSRDERHRQDDNRSHGSHRSDSYHGGKSSSSYDRSRDRDRPYNRDHRGGGDYRQSSDNRSDYGHQSRGQGQGGGYRGNQNNQNRGGNNQGYNSNYNNRGGYNQNYRGGYRGGGGGYY